MLVFGAFLRESARTAAKSRTNLSTNSGKPTKRLGRLAPNVAHMCKFIWERIYAKQIAPRDKRGALGGFRGSTIQKSIGKLSDWHRLWFTSVDSSGNGHRLNKSRASIPQVALGGGGVGGHNLKSLGKLSNGCADWHRSWYTSADSSGNGHRLNTIRPTIPQGHLGFLGGNKFKCLGKRSNGWSDWHQIWYKSADSSGNGHGLNAIGPSIPQGVLGGGVTNSKVWGSCQTTGPFGTKFSTRLWIHLGVDIG